jgi:hypothetical protein
MGLLTTSELGALGEPGWYGTHASPRTFREGVRMLGGGGTATVKMEMIWSHRRPGGFWASRRGKGWARVSPGNMTPAMLRALLVDIQAYEDQRGIESAWRMTPPSRHRRQPRPRPKASPRPRPRPRTETRTPVATARRVPATLVSVARSAPARPVTGQRYARQARHGVATGGHPAARQSYVSMPK